MYISAVSEEDQKKGRAVGDVLMFRYLGEREEKHLLVRLEDDGSIMARYECASPCKVIKRTTNGAVERIPYDPSSVLGSVFEDALAGRLEIARTTASKDTTAASTAIPKPFQGEWNTDLAACGTGLNDSRLRITASEMQFYESTGKVTKVKSEGPRVISVTSSFSGEGEKWTNTEKLTLSPSGAELTIDGFARQRCPA